MSEIPLEHLEVRAVAAWDQWQAARRRERRWAWICLGNGFGLLGLAMLSEPWWLTAAAITWTVLAMGWHTRHVRRVRRARLASDAATEAWFRPFLARQVARTRARWEAAPRCPVCGSSTADHPASGQCPLGFAFDPEAQP